MKRNLAMAVIVAGLLSTSTQVTAGAVTRTPVKQYVLANPHAKCKLDYRKATLKVKRGGKTVRVVGCVYSAPPTSKPPNPVVTTTTTTTTTTTIPTEKFTPSFIALCSGVPAPIGVQVTKFDCDFNLLTATANLPYPECNSSTNFGTLTLTSPTSAPGAAPLSVSWGGVCGGSTVEADNDVDFGAVGFTGSYSAWTYSGGSYLDVQGQKVVLSPEVLSVPVDVF